MDKNPEFDALLGGNIDLPTSVNLLKFTAARWKEIRKMKQALSETTATKLAFQKLPKHMRRRVMSHNAKRLPRRLREIHLNQLKKSGMPPKQKRPSRKYRRRPRNLIEEYARRQRKHKWLETHIWHAKRFHMVERWGYRLPERPCDKAFRACYRATAKHCLVQDISYLGCIEINGEESLLIEKLKDVCDSKCGLTVAAKAFRNGVREGKFVMFKRAGTVQRAIGNINFQWKPPTSSESSRTLWLWVHAAYYEEVLNTLVDLLTLQSTNVNDGSLITSYINSNNNIVVKDLRYDLNRFRLSGPLSNAVLQNAFKPVNLTTELDFTWLKQFLESEENRQIFAAQLQFWKNIKNVSSLSQLSPHSIISLIISDPRYNLPKVKTKALPDCSQFGGNEFCEVPQGVSSGPIWKEDIRRQVKENKLSNATIAEMRSLLLVPGSDLDKPGAPVPITLIQRPGNRENNLGYCSGWDVIIPSGWAQPAWISLVMWGARPGGLRESESISFEMGEPHTLAPDTEAGAAEEKRITELCVKQFFKLPPNKRTNFNKFAISSPFCCNWKLLVKEWASTAANDFYVLRDKKQLASLQNLLKGTSKNLKEVDFNANCIVPVKLTLDNRGKSVQFSIICLPKTEDLKKNNEPTEPLCQDVNKEKRKEIRDNHKMLLKKLRRQRIKAKKEGKSAARNEDVLKEFTEKMRNLWLPEPTTIRKSCSREVMGFVTKGDFSFTLGGSSAVGYVAVGAFRKLLEDKLKNKVLIRNTGTRQYRVATVQIVC